MMNVPFYGDELSHLFFVEQHLKSCLNSSGKHVDEMQSKSPTLLWLLMHLVSHSDCRNDAKQGDHHYPVVFMSAAVILKERNREMVGLPTYISLLLFSSHAHKQIHALAVITLL